jgi:putative transposase
LACTVRTFTTSRSREHGEDLQLTRLIDEEYLRRLFPGSRRIGLRLEKQGEQLNRKKSQRLMRKMCLQGIAPEPRTTRRKTSHMVCPCLLRGAEIIRPNQVWSCDITYVPLAGGYLPMSVVRDW